MNEYTFICLFACPNKFKSKRIKVDFHSEYAHSWFQSPRHYVPVGLLTQAYPTVSSLRENHNGERLSTTLLTK